MVPEGSALFQGNVFLWWKAPTYRDPCANTLKTDFSVPTFMVLGTAPVSSHPTGGPIGFLVFT